MAPGPVDWTALPFAGDVLSELTGVVEGEGGELAWVEERLLRTAGGAYVWVAARCVRPGAQEVVHACEAASAAELVAVMRARGGVDPGRVELLGRAGIEVGCLPGDGPEE